MTISFAISARGKELSTPIFRFLRDEFGTTPLAEIDSVFGFVEPSTLYGGRIFEGRQLSDRDCAQLMNSGIGIRIPMTNHFTSYDEYKRYEPLLRKYYCPLNSIIVTNPELAQWIKNDFPDYGLEASVIQNLNTSEKIERALDTDLYDMLVLPMELNDKDEFLNSLPCKDKIRLFCNAGCALTCPAKICYRSISKINKGEANATFKCSQTVKWREQRGMIDFDIPRLIRLGFSRFKLLRGRPGGMTGY